MGIKKNQLGTALGAAATPLALAEQATPTAEANKIKLYSKDMLGASEFFVQDDLGNEVQVTSGGAVNGSSGGMPFTAPINVTGNVPVTLNAINVMACNNSILQLPVTPGTNDRFGILTDAVQFLLDGQGNPVLVPYAPGSCSAPFTAYPGAPHSYLEYQWNGSSWELTSRGQYGASLQVMDEGNGIAGDSLVQILNVTGAGASVSGSGNTVTLNVPGGSFPPIANFQTYTGGPGPGNTATSILAVSNCSYVVTLNQLNVCGTNFTLYLPQTPANADHVGLVLRGPNGLNQAFVAHCGGTIPVWAPNGSSASANSQTLSTVQATLLWRYSFNQSEWTLVQK